MLMLFKKQILLLLLTGLLKTAAGQDLHFSQFFNSPLTTNPANTGFIPDADYRIGAHFRNQWSSILADPYRTFSLFADAQVFRDRIDNGWLGMGALILSDEAGSGGLKSTKIYGSVAYHQMLGLNSLLTAGFNLGWANKRIDRNKLKFPDQFDGKFFDVNLPTGVVLENTSISYFDMQAGLNYALFPSDDVYFNIGYSIHHINRPVESFFSGPTDNSRIPMRHIGFVNAVLKTGDRVIINPSVYYTNQAAASSLVAGFSANYNLSGTGGDKQLLAGLFYRAGDAVIPMVGLELHNIRFTFSYDATTSGLKNFNNANGAQEFSLLKKGYYGAGDVRQSLCPRF